MPHRDSYYGNSQNTSRRDSDSGDIDELLDIPLDDDLLEYIKNNHSYFGFSKDSGDNREKVLDLILKGRGV